MIERLAIVAAGLAGALGVAAAARASHGGGENLAIAAQFLLFHAPALMGLAALIRLGMLARGIAIIALLLFVAGLSLFSGDLAMRALVGSPLFRMAAPIGGSMLILGWLALAVAALRAEKISGG